MIDPSTGLIRKDSSIWETHWNGRERYWSYTDLTAVRGLATRRSWPSATATTPAPPPIERRRDLRQAMVDQLLDADFALASNKEELDVGEGYWDAAVLDAFAMGVFDPAGIIAAATLAGMDADLGVAASGVGWSRNDDRTDHPGVEDISPWGSDYEQRRVGHHRSARRHGRPRGRRRGARRGHHQLDRGAGLRELPHGRRDL